LRAPAALQGERSEAKSKDLLNEQRENPGPNKICASKSKISPFHYVPVEMTVRVKQRERPGPIKIPSSNPKISPFHYVPVEMTVRGKRSESQGTIKTSPSKSKIFPFRFAPVKMTVIVNTAFQSPLSSGARRNDGQGESKVE
jgi:hypothetical protein